MIVDGTIVGTEPLTAGDTSTAYEVTPGTRVVEAKTQTQPGRNWSPYTVTLKAGQDFTRVLECCPFCLQTDVVSDTTPRERQALWPSARVRLVSVRS